MNFDKTKARTAALLYGLAGDGKPHGLDTFEYPRDVVGRMSGRPDPRIAEFLPR